MEEKYSVLMSVYHKEKPEYLRQSLESIFTQTIQTDDFVLVCDGPLNPGLDAVVDEMQGKYGDILHIVRLKENMGLGHALNKGIQFCQNDLIARMDSDDISRPDRCEKQLTVFDVRPEISICSGTVEEFSESKDVIDAKRILPETQEQIIEFSKKRTPFNHPCVMYRKSAVEAAGGYQDFYLLEDYYLWLRMLLNGCKGYNLQEPLLWMRAGSEMYKRRAGWRYAKSQVRLFNYMKERAFISNNQYVKSCLIRCGSSMAPNWLRKFMFRKVVRN